MYVVHVDNVTTCGATSGWSWASNTNDPAWPRWAPTDDATETFRVWGRFGWRAINVQKGSPALMRQQVSAEVSRVAFDAPALRFGRVGAGRRVVLGRHVRRTPPDAYSMRASRRRIHRRRR